MENYWELEPNEVQVDVKDEKHLDELFEMCELFDLKNYKDKYRNSNNWFRMSTLNPWFSNYTFEYKFTEVTTEQFYEILCHNYGYQGKLKGFDKEVVIRMLECQVEQGNERNMKVLENHPSVGFNWSKTWEGHRFWGETIFDNKGKFTKQDKISETAINYEKLYNELFEKFNQLKKILK